MALTLTITDQADGTGATATVAGSGGGLVTIHTQSFAGVLGAGTWASTATKMGDGTADLALTTGHYFAYCDSAGVVAPVVYFAVTDGVASVCQRIEEAVQARLRLIGLAGIANADIVIRDVPTDRNLTTHPCIVVSPVRPTMDGTASVLHKNDVVYAERVSIFAVDNQSAEDNGDTYRLWIEQIARAFRSQRLSGVSEVFHCEVVPGMTIPPLDWLANRYVGEVVLKFTARETSGL